MKPLALVLVLALSAFSQVSANPPQVALGAPRDWSHRHVVFSGAGTRQTRAMQQWIWRHAAPKLAATAAPMPWEGDRFSRAKRKKTPVNLLHRDWASSLGPGTSISAGQYPAKYSFSVTTATCGNAATPDFVVFPASIAGSGTQASIVAFDNLYSGCTGTVPSTYWAYNTGGAVVTSPALSLDGSQLMFVQSSGGAASLVLLKWQASSSASSTTPDAIASVAPSSYQSCTAPCMTTLAFSGTVDDTNSSPYYDYSADNLYAGDNNGSLHLFHPVLLGTPAEVTSPWPVSLASGKALSSPVLDVTSGRVFIGSSFSGGTGGQLFAVNGATGAISATSAAIAKGNGITSSPVLDSSAGKVYVFAGNDGSSACFGSVACSAVYQFATSFTNGASGIKATVGTNATTLYPGDFDNAWYTSANSTGALYVCGKDFTGLPNMYRITITAGTMSTTATFGPHMGGGATNCSPVTDVYNSGQASDRVFSSVTNNGNAVGCGNAGCIQSLVVTNWQPSTAYTVGQAILDSNSNMEIVGTAGTSKSGSAPAWNVTPGALTTDGSVVWVNQGFYTPITPRRWQASTTYSKGSSILDANGNIQLCPGSQCTTGTTEPTWSTTIGAFTSANGSLWTNGGPLVNFGLAASGGTSGIIMDNTVGSGTLSGASQLYYTPLSTGNCGVGNGCAVQASQAGLN